MTRADGRLTVTEAAAQLYKSPTAVRKLVRAGKLEAVREGGRLLVSPESVARYVSHLPHPPHLMADMYEAWLLLAVRRWRERLMPGELWKVRAQPETLAFETYFVDPALPLFVELLDALRVRDYGRAEALHMDVVRLRFDYAMLYEPLAPEGGEGARA